MLLTRLRTGLIPGLLISSLAVGCGGGGGGGSAAAGSGGTANTNSNTGGTSPINSSGTVSLGGNTSSGSAVTGATASGFGAGTGVFSDATGLVPNTTFNDWGADTGDLDGDGDMDVAIAVNGGTPRILLNDGTGSMTEATGAFAAGSFDATDVRVIDADGDNDLDLLFSANYDSIRLYTNNGSGVFTQTQAFPASNDALTYKLAIGDADGDGDLDVFMANAGQSVPSRGQNRLFINNFGVFTEAPTALPALNNDSLDATFVDVDGDLDNDLVVVNFGQSPVLLLNDGTGNFSDASTTHLPAGLSFYSTSVAQGDVDGDGDLDLFIGNEGPALGAPPAGEANALLLNDGTGVFSDGSSALPSDAEATWCLRMVDVNSDGQLDVIASSLRAIERLYINQNGSFIDATSFFPPANQVAGDSLGVTVGDFNGDRAPDVFFCRRNAQPWLFLNAP